MEINILNCDEIQLEILDLCREGTALLFKLEKEVEEEKEMSSRSLDFMEVIQEMQKQLTEFNDYMPIILIILDKSFNFKKYFQT